MKKVDPFSGIPAVPTSLAGQWLAFSHMANHYRKLLNVKSRVNSSAPLKAPMPFVPPLSAYLQQPQLPPKIKNGLAIPSSPCCSSCPQNKSILNNNATVRAKAKMASTRPPLDVTGGYTSAEDVSSSSPQTKNKKVNSNKSIKNKTNLQTVEQNKKNSFVFNYDLMYGPDSFKSSTDGNNGLASDCESINQPRVETMGVTEKIKVFLDNLHEFENNSDTKKKSTKNKESIKKPVTCCSHCGHSPIMVKKKIGTLEQSPIISPVPTKTRESRHMNCFIPITSPSESPKKIVKKVTTTTTPVMQRRIPLSEAISKIKSTKSVATSKLGVIGSVPKEKKKERYLSGGSMGSVGTIRGSEDFATEVIMKPPHNKNSHHSHSSYHQMIPTKEKSISRTRTPSAGYSSGKAMSNLGVNLNVNLNKMPKTNKDSSRDSAYGFSSGESRITTRESTPEKLLKSKKSPANMSKRTTTVVSSGKRSSGEQIRGRHNSALSTVASSVNFELGGGGSCGVLGKSAEKKKSRLTTDDKYLNFLTEVTDDIVTRGIYTNRGLKMLFNDHVERHSELSVDRMTEMVEKLRMDLGIPKDDSLNKLEFGYGSVLNKNKTTPTDITTSTTTSAKFHYPPKRTSGLDEAFSDEFMAPPQPHPSYDNSPVLPRPAHQAPLDSESEEVSCCQSETSLSETELQRTLKEVGIERKMVQEIVGMIKHSSSPKHGGSGGSSDEFGGGGSRNKQPRRAHLSCSTPATSHTSTVSS